jgi:hypothetical protein
MTDWFAKVPPRVASSIAPVPQDRPPFWLVLIAFVVAVAPVAGFVLWAWM